MQAQAEPLESPSMGHLRVSPPEVWDAPIDGAVMPVLGPKPPIVWTPETPSQAIPDEDLAGPSVPEIGRHLHDQMLYDLQGTDHWAMGKLYKARANQDGFCFMPFLGSDAPKTYEWSVRLDSSALGGETIALTAQAQTTREGDRITLDRGPIQVWYDMSLDAVEQSFAMDRGGVDGDWILNLAVESELAFEPLADGVGYFNELGGVVYRHAVVVDGAGHRLDIPIHADPSSLRLVVPARFMRAAVAPVVVDPIVTTYQIHPAYNHNLQYPDVAYDLDTDQFAYVHQSEFSATDYDVFIETVNAAGAYVATAAVDFTSADVRTPSVANDHASDQYLVVCRRLNAASAFEVIGRTVSTTVLTSQSPVFLIGDANVNWTNVRVDVGGKSQGTPLFMVVWDRAFTSPAQTDARAALVTPVVPLSNLVAPSVGGLIVLSSSTTVDDTQVKISESSGKASVATWRIANIRTEIATGDQEIMGASFADNGTMTSAPASLFMITNSFVAQDLDISEPLADQLGDHGGPAACLAIQFLNGTSVSIWAIGLDGNNNFGEMNLKAGEHTNPAARPRYPSVSALATRFVVSYVEFDGDYTCYSSALDVVPYPVLGAYRLGVNERRAVVSPLGASYDFVRPASASRYSGGFYTSRYVAVGVSKWNGTYYEQNGAIEFPSLPTTCAAQFCQGNPNSTGDYGFINLVGTNDLVSTKTLLASALPLNQFGYFLAGQGGYTSVSVPGSAGVLCISGGPIGRYNLGVEVFFTGTTGTGSLDINPMALRGPTGNVVGLAGQFWHFQAWHRENGGSSNFTNAIRMFMY